MALGQQFGDLRTDVKDAQSEQKPGQGPPFACHDVGHDLGGKLVAHAVHLEQLFLLEVVEARHVDHQSLVDEDSAQCCISAIWLLHHFLDESHVISQEITTSSGSFWHGILHRREGDYSNAKYWFRRVVDHPVYELLATTSQQLQDQHQWPGSLPLGGTQWDPYKFVEMCEDVVVNGGGNRVLCEALARLEWQLLFDNCYRRAIGSG